MLPMFVRDITYGRLIKKQPTKQTKNSRGLGSMTGTLHGCETVLLSLHGCNYLFVLGFSYVSKWSPYTLDYFIFCFPILVPLTSACFIKYYQSLSQLWRLRPFALLLPQDPTRSLSKQLINVTLILHQFFSSWPIRIIECILFINFRYWAFEVK